MNTFHLRIVTMDGKVFDVREQFKKNIFSITLADADPEKLGNFLQMNGVLQHHSDNNLSTFEITRHDDQNALISQLVQIGKILGNSDSIMNGITLQLHVFRLTA